MTAAPHPQPAPTRSQLEALAHATLLDDDGPLALAADLTPEDLASSRTFANARHLLTAVLAEGKVPATKTLGNLSRRFSTRMLDELAWPDGYVTEVRRFNRATDEHDIGKLQYLRVALQHAGLLRKYRGAFLGTKKAERLLKPEQAGDLFRELFVAWFGKTNIGFLDGYPEDPYMQHCTPFALWQLGREAREWRTAFELAPGLPHDERIWAEDARWQPLSGERDPWRSLGAAYELRVLRPLHDFGLLERDPAEEPHWGATPRWRVTPLFDRFVRFDFTRTHGKPKGLMSEFAAYIVRSGQLGSIATARVSLALFALWMQETAKRALIEQSLAAGGPVSAEVNTLLESLTAADVLDTAPDFVTAVRASSAFDQADEEPAVEMIEVFAEWAAESGRAPEGKALSAIAFAHALRGRN